MTKNYGLKQTEVKLAQRLVVEEIMRAEYYRSVHIVWAGCMIGMKANYNKRKSLFAK